MSVVMIFILKACVMTLSEDIAAVVVTVEVLNV